MQISMRQLCAEEFLGRRERPASADAALDPHFADFLAAPVGKQTHAVTERLDVLEMILHLTKRKILIDVLPHLISGLNLKGHASDHAQCAKPDYGALKLRRIGFAV